jgi:hypothetical protein
MGRQVKIGPVETRFVPVGAGDADLWVVGHQLRRHAAHAGESADMRADPVGQPLRPARLGVGVQGSRLLAQLSGFGQFVQGTSEQGRGGE